MTIRLLPGDCRLSLATLEPESAQASITSPPYWGLRDYGTAPLVWGGKETCVCAGPVAPRFLATTGDAKFPCCSSCQGCKHEWAEGVVRGQTGGLTPKQVTNIGSFHGGSRIGMCPCGAWLGSLGLEPTPELYVEHLVEVFRGVRRVLRDDGLLWLNLGDSYAGSGKGPNTGNSLANGRGDGMPQQVRQGFIGKSPVHIPGYKPKDLMMLPARVAIALQADGWYLRSMIPWLKKNAMPESVRDRPASAVEYVFLLSKSRTYYWDADAVREPHTHKIQRYLSPGRKDVPSEYAAGGSKIRDHRNYDGVVQGNPAGRSRRNTDWFFESWQGLLADDDGDPLALVVNPAPYKGAHYATFPPKLVEPMIKASTGPGDVVLDPFGGSGTVGMVADRLGRNAVLCELKPDYGEQATARLMGDAPMFVEIEGGAATMPPEPVKDKQAVVGKRTYSGFNARWDAKETA